MICAGVSGILRYEVVEVGVGAVPRWLARTWEGRRRDEVDVRRLINRLKACAEWEEKTRVIDGRGEVSTRASTIGGGVKQHLRP